MYDHIPVYQITYELLITISKITMSFPKEYKYTFGERLQNYSIDSLAEITLATNEFENTQKIRHIKNAKKSIALIKVIMRACNEINILSHTAYTNIMNSLFDISKQLDNRYNAIYKKQNPKNG